MRIMVSIPRYKKSAYHLVIISIIIIGAHLKTCRGTPIMSPRDSIGENTARPEVEIPQGVVKGVNMVTHRGRAISGFLGIPYAQPPVGNLRFQAPVPAGPWNGTLDASRNSIICPQHRGGAVIGTEDCLHLHVYSPQLPSRNNSALLPVMLYIFGGVFKSGSNNPEEFGPYYLLDKDVVLVVPNYRIGVFGYLSTGDEVSPGNNALKDLVRALEWNRENIRYFGGDAERVTIFGGSSGGTSAHYLTLTNITNNLFHRYIMQSGSGLGSDVIESRISAAKRTTQFGEHLGCPTNTSIDLVNCLRSISVSRLIDATLIFEKWLHYPIGAWRLSIEPDIQGALITDAPEKLLAAGRMRDLPSIVSLVRDEGIYLHTKFYKSPELFERLLKEIEIALPEILDYSNRVENVTAYTAALRSYFFNDLTADSTLLLNNYTQLAADVHFNYPAYRGVVKQLNEGRSPVYFGSFEYRGTPSCDYYESDGLSPVHGVTHGDELNYLFQDRKFLYGPPGYKMNETDLKMVDTMVQLWTSFATNGTPTAGPHSTTIWEPFSSRGNYLRIGNESDVSLAMNYNLLRGRLPFWDELTAATRWEACCTSVD